MSSLKMERVSVLTSMGLFRWREENHQEDLRRRIILAPYVFCIRFRCKGLYLSLALRSSYSREVGKLFRLLGSSVIPPCKQPLCVDTIAKFPGKTSRVFILVPRALSLPPEPRDLGCRVRVVSTERLHCHMASIYIILLKEKKGFYIRK